MLSMNMLTLMVDTARIQVVLSDGLAFQMRRDQHWDDPLMLRARFLAECSTSARCGVWAQIDVQTLHNCALLIHSKVTITHQSSHKTRFYIKQVHSWGQWLESWTSVVRTRIQKNPRGNTLSTGSFTLQCSGSLSCMSEYLVIQRLQCSSSLSCMSEYLVIQRLRAFVVSFLTITNTT